MMDEIAKFLRELSRESLDEIEGEKAIRLLKEYRKRAARVYGSFSSIMEISIIPMMIGTDMDFEEKKRHANYAADNYDVTVAVKDGSGCIHEIEEIEGLRPDQIDAELERLAAVYPRAKVLDYRNSE